MASMTRAAISGQYGFGGGGLSGGGGAGGFGGGSGGGVSLGGGAGGSIGPSGVTTYAPASNGPIGAGTPAGDGSVLITYDPDIDACPSTPGMGPTASATGIPAMPDTAVVILLALLFASGCFAILRKPNLE